MRAESRARILDSALRLFAAHGYDRTPVRTIAEHAGVSTGLLYHYFPGKGALLRALFEATMADVRESFARAAAAQTPAERLGTLIRSAFDIVDMHRDFWRLAYAIRLQPSVLSSLGPELPAWTVEILETLERHLRELGVASPETEARILFATIDGVCQHSVVAEEGYPLAEIGDALIARYAPVAALRSGARLLDARKRRSPRARRSSE
jgi:AcrR family transcriptional regulator